MENNHRKTLMKVALTFALLGSATYCLKGCINDYSEIVHEKVEEMPESTDTMAEKDKAVYIYNEYLKSKYKNVSSSEQAGPVKKLTEEDIVDIELNTNRGMLNSLKRANGEIAQVGDSYIFVEEDNELKLYDSKDSECDLLTGLERDKNKPYEMIGHFDEFISFTHSEPIGYTTQKKASWTISDKKYVIDEYGMEIFDCFRECGFPLPMYSVNDLYDEYESYKNDKRLTRNRRN